MRPDQPRLAIAALAALALPAPAADIAIGVSEPRGFGHVIGEVIERRIVADAPAPLALERDALPAPGRAGAWLELRSTSVAEHASRSGRRYAITLAYQVMNVPAVPAVVSLPTLQLRFAGEGETRSVQTLTGPSLGLVPIAAPGGSDLRPDHAPPRVASEGARLRLRVYAALLAAIAAWFAWQRFGLPLLSLRHRPFARAAREVARLQRAGDFRQAVLTLHRAFDQSAGAAMFGASAGGFVAGRPAFAPIAGDVQRFFTLSQREFFAGGAGRDFAWLAAFAAACRDAELRG